MIGNLNISRIERLNIEFPIIFRLRGHHDDTFFILNNLEDLDDLCVRLVRDQEYWYDEYIEPVPPKGFTKETINDLPESLRLAAESEWNKYESELLYWKNVQIEKEIYKKAMDGDVQAARMMIEFQHNDCDGWEVIFPSKIDDFRKDSR